MNKKKRHESQISMGVSTELILSAAFGLFFSEHNWLIIFSQALVLILSSLSFLINLKLYLRWKKDEE